MLFWQFDLEIFQLSKLIVPEKTHCLPDLLLPLLPQAGEVIFTASALDFASKQDLVGYAASKGAIENLTGVFAMNGPNRALR